MKKILLVILVLLGIFIPNKVFAYSDSFREDEYIPGAYIKKFKGSIGKYEQMRVFRRNGDNKPVYCIQLWEPISNNKILEGYDTNQNSYIGLNDTTWNKIVNIAYFGYGYKNHTDLKWYAVTQLMIWQILEGDNNVYFTDTLNGNKTNKYDNEINEIKNLIQEELKLPSFSTEFDLYYNHDYEFVDRNNVFKDFETLSVPSGINFRRDDTTIYVTSTSYQRKSISFIKKDKLYPNNPIVYIDDSGQNLLLPGSYTPLIKTVNYTVPKTDFTINKLDSETGSTPQGEASLDGSVFELYDEKHNYIGTSTVNNGKAIFKNIGKGYYYLKEVTAGEGYVLNDNEIYVDNLYKFYNFNNSVIKNKIIINKYLKDHDGTLTLEDASFNILDKDGNTVLNIDTVSGYSEFYLPYGTYTLTQVTGNDKYNFIEDQVIEVKGNNKTQELNLYDLEKADELELLNRSRRVIDDDIDEIDNEEVIEGKVSKISYKENDTYVYNDIPNTYTKGNSNYTYIIVIGLGICLIHIGKRNEEN